VKLHRKGSEEEITKKYEEARNNDATPMDTDIPEISTTGASDILNSMG
jgi:hypothetical protein